MVTIPSGKFTRLMRKKSCHVTILRLVKGLSWWTKRRAYGDTYLLRGDIYIDSSFPKCTYEQIQM